MLVGALVRTNVAQKDDPLRNGAASLGRNHQHHDAEQMYAAILEAPAAPGAVASPKFVATTRVRRAFCLMESEVCRRAANASRESA